MATWVIASSRWYSLPQNFQTSKTTPNLRGPLVMGGACDSMIRGYAPKCSSNWVFGHWRCLGWGRSADYLKCVGGAVAAHLKKHLGDHSSHAHLPLLNFIKCHCSQQVSSNWCTIFGVVTFRLFRTLYHIPKRLFLHLFCIFNV